MIGILHFSILSIIIFCIGLCGVMINRTSIINILMSIELMLLAVNINFVAFSSYLGDISGNIYVLMVLTVAAAEVAVGLAILVLHFYDRKTIQVTDINQMRG